ncbi:MAG TPA: hypothetical protein VLB51_09705 [Methylomirabilota bacterium]|nr:hypothetical protein [Methylomirabilota bacterium]
MGLVRFGIGGVVILTLACGGGTLPPTEGARVEAATETSADDLDSLVRRAVEAHRAGAFDEALELSLRAEQLLPGHPRLLFNTACALLATGDPDGSLDRLERIAAIQVTLDLESSDCLAPLRGHPRFLAVAEAMAALAEPVERSAVAFTVPDSTFLVEGVAVDPATGELLLSSLYQRRIVRVAADGRTEPLTKPDDELWSMLGMAIAPDGRSLWTVTVASPRMQDAAPDEPLRSALLRISLADGRVLARFDPPAGLASSALDSVAVAADGTVFVSDSGAGAIHRLVPGGDGLEVLVEPGSFISTQGLALSADGRMLWAADYGRGVAAVDPDSGRLRFLDHSGPSLVGIDGLERHGADLIAIQNGIEPPRVVRIVLGDEGTSVARVELLERAHRLYREPTLGVVVGDELLYVAASQWRSFDDEGRLLLDELVEPVILRLPLGGTAPGVAR